MKTICLYFQVHQPMRFRRYRFFDIGHDSYYYDDYLNESIMRKVADKCYLPTNKLLLKLIKEYGVQFKVSFSITGIALDQFRLYTPEVLDSFRELADTGCVDFLAETYSHSLVSLKDRREFEMQVDLHREKIEEYFGIQPTIFRNTELIYSNDIGAMVADMGFSGILTEGAKHILGWKSPNYLYFNVINPKLKVLLKNYKLSDDIAFRFSNSSWDEYPLTAEKYVAWLHALDSKEETINLFLDYETFGEHQSAETGIFSFLEKLPKQVFAKTRMTFSTPADLVKNLQPVAPVHVPYPISWADEERDLTAWLGNDMQEDAFNTLYSLIDKINKCTDKKILTDWKYLQASDHFYYMSTKMLSDGDVHSYFNPFDSPYDAYINYMNILSDFIIRLNASVPESDTEQEIATLAAIIYEKNLQLEKYEAEIKRLKESGKKKSTALASDVVKVKSGTRKTADKVAAIPKTTSKSKATAASAKTVKRSTGKKSTAKSITTKARSKK
ncbi:MAG: polysaccharide deacetylase family protein [Bacteroidales bacterium]|nr:polysaccharide deacetylase family protein [Bacteroidales bacterium]